MTLKNKIVIILGFVIFLGIGFKKVVDYQDYNPTVIIQANKFNYYNSFELLKRTKFSQEFRANNNNLGIISVFFNTHNRINDDFLQFSIKEKGQDKWYYSNKYKVDQFQNNQYFPFGFPEIKNSKGKIYQIEIESLNGTEGNSVQLINTKPFLSKYSFPKDFLLQNKKEIPLFMVDKVISFFSHINLINCFWILIVLVFFHYILKIKKIKKISKIFYKKVNFFIKIKKISYLNKFSLNFIVSYLIASVIAMSIFYLLKNQISLGKIQLVFSNINIVQYIVSIFLFCSVFVVSFLIINRYFNNFFMKDRLVSKNVTNIIIFVSLFLYLVIVWLMSINSKKVVGYESMNNFTQLEIMLFILIALCLFFAFRNLIFRSKFSIKSKVFWVVVSIVIAGITACFLYSPNSFPYSFHYGAYYNSVYLQQQGIPYSNHFVSVYGHYGIFLGLLFNIININSYSVAIVTVVIGFISILCVIYVIYNLIKTSLFRFAGLFVMIFPFVRSNVASSYPQLFPHRLIFPSIIMALGVLLIKHLSHHKKLLLVIGYVTSVLAIIWNNETGMACLIAWGSLHGCLIFSKNSFKVSHFFKLLIPILLIVISFFCAWGITCLYNFSLGGNFLSLYYFLFPLLEVHYMWDVLHLEIPLFITYWMPILLLLFAFIGLGITNIFIFNKKLKLNNKIVLGFFISILGLGQFTYFMNRCAYFSLYIAYYQIVILLLLTLEYTFSAFLNIKKTISDIIKTIIFCCSFCTLIILVVLFLININFKISSMKQYVDMNNLNDTTSYIKKHINKDTPIVGINTATLGIALGWKNELEFTDSSDLFIPENMEYVINTLVSYGKPFLIEKNSYISLNSISEKFRTITDKYNIQEFNEKSVPLLYLTPKKNN